MELNKIYNEDCLEGMKRIPDKSVDMILCDLPYGTTACSWDTIIPFEPLWEQYERVIKDNGAIVLTAIQPFTSALVMSNPKLFKREWIWEKTIAPNFLTLSKGPAKKHESVLVFYKNQPTYNPQMEVGEPYKDTKRKRSTGEVTGNEYMDYLKKETYKKEINNKGTRYPSTIQKFANPNNKNFHPTQKPVALFEYLIKTYTNKNETVLDNCMGSGTTAIACMNTERNFIGFELDKKYYEKSLERIKNHTTQTDIFDLLEGE